MNADQSDTLVVASPTEDDRCFSDHPLTDQDSADQDFADQSNILVVGSQMKVMKDCNDHCLTDKFLLPI